MDMRFKCLLILSAALLMPMFPAFAQDLVTGVVTDEHGEPLIGAGVIYEGTKIGVVTDFDGRYSIERLSGKTLQFSSVGMQGKEVLVKAQKEINVILMPDNIMLDDAVVIGYGSLSRRDLTGSVSSVKADELARTGSSNVFGALQGHVAGLSITSQSGEPGAGYNIKIRGNNSINAGTTPLFVIDGLQMDISSSEIATSTTTGSSTFDPLSFINPNDIESIEVLKDATATAIYGSRGANGVIIITTRSGATGTDKTIVNFSASVGISNVPKYIPMLDPQEYCGYRFSRKDYGWDGYGIDTDGDGVPDTVMDASGYEHYDWQKLMYRTAVTQDYNVSVNAIANKKTQLLVSLGYLHQDGLIINNDYERYTGRIKLDHRISSKVKIGASVNYGRNISNGAVASGGGELGSSGLIQLIYLRRPFDYYAEAEETDNMGSYSLIDCVTDETYRKTVYSRITGNAYVDWEIVDGLTFNASASGNTSGSKGMEFYTGRSLWGYSRNGYAKIKSVDTSGWNASATLTYKKTWNKVHNFDAMLGGELGAYHYENLTLGAYDFTDDSTGVFDISKGGIQESPSENITGNSRMSVFWRINYNYRQRYYISFNMRADGSSKFMAGNRAGYFPSVSVAWRLSEEEFMKSAGWLNQFKLRFSAGSSGNDRITDYAPMALMTTNYYAVGGTEIMGMAPSSSANTGLKWETTVQYDLGLDLGLWGSRVELLADVYYKDTRDMLYRATLPAQTGYVEQWQNLGRVSNKGIEISLNTHNIQTRNFSWSTNVTFDLCRNKVLDIGGIEYTSVNIANGVLANDISRIMKGYPIGIGYGYVADGNYQLTDFYAVDKVGNRFNAEDVVSSDNYDNYKYELKEGVVSINSVTVQPGDRKYRDYDGDDEVTVADKRVISDSNPDFTMGFGNTFNFRGFELSFFFEGVYGRDIMNEFKLRSESGQSGGTQYNNLRKDAWYGRWTPENPSNTCSRLLNQTNTWVSSYYVEDGSYIRLKNLTLSYTFDTPRLRKAKISSIRLNFNADNLFVITKYSGMDPDVSTSNPLFTGFDRMSYPKARSFTFGLNMTF